LRVFFILFFSLSLFAQNSYSFRVAYGKATASDFGEVISLQHEASPVDSKVLAIDGGYLLKEGVFDWPMDIYIKAGFSKFSEGSITQTNEYGYFVYEDKDVYEGVIHIKAYYNFDFWQNRIRLGFGEGISYTSSILNTEKYEADSENDNNSKFLNYIDFSVDFDFGRLIGYKPLSDTYIGWVIKHRSGIYGLVNNVRRGGSNYNTIYIEKKF